DALVTTAGTGTTFDARHRSLPSAVGEEDLDATLERGRDHVLIAETATPRARLADHHVREVALRAAHLARSGNLEALLGAAVRLHLGHGESFSGPRGPRRARTYDGRDVLRQGSSVFRGIDAGSAAQSRGFPGVGRPERGSRKRGLALKSSGAPWKWADA